MRQKNPNGFELGDSCVHRSNNVQDGDGIPVLVCPMTVRGQSCIYLCRTPTCPWCKTVNSVLLGRPTQRTLHQQLSLSHRGRRVPAKQIDTQPAIPLTEGPLPLPI